MTNVKIIQLSEVTTQINTRNKNISKLPVWSITNEKGFVNSDEFFKKRVYSKNLKNYKIISPSEIAYNPSRVNVGSIGHNDSNEKALLSPLYVIVKCSPELNPQFLIHFMKSDFGRNKIQYHTQGSVRDSLVYRNFSEIEISLPSLKNQEKIVRILDQIENLKKKQTNVKKLLSVLIQSIFYEMFGSEDNSFKNGNMIKLNQICEKITDGEHQTPPRQKNGILLLSARNVRNGYIDLNQKTDHISENTYQKIRKRCNPEIGDVLLTCSGTVGRVSSVSISEPFGLVRSVALLKPKKNVINPVFLEKYLQMPFSQKQIKEKSKKSSQANIFQGAIKELDILLPPNKKQEIFVSKIKKINKILEMKNSAFNEVVKLNDTLQSMFFNGKYFYKDSN
jgi:type I restriction enzyme, S subunit